jgi:multidrug resistance efflux pump
MTVKRRPVLLALALTILVLIGVGARWMLSTGGESANTERTDDAGGSGSKVVVTGHVDVEDRVVTLFPLQPGRVEVVLVKENQQVSAGMELLRVENKLARWKLEQAKADLKAAEALLEKARQGPDQHNVKIRLQSESVEAMKRRLKSAQLKLKRAKELLDSKLLKDEDYDAAVEQVTELQIGVETERDKLGALKKINPELDVIRAEANVQAKKFQLEEARFGLRETILRAPADGLILRVNVSPGDLISPQLSESAILFSPNQPRIIRANVEQEFADRVREGYRAEVRDYINPRLGPWKGRVARVADIFLHTRGLMPQPFPMLANHDTRTLECIIVLDPDQPPLRLGQQVRVTIRPGKPN